MRHEPGGDLGNGRTAGIGRTGSGRNSGGNALRDGVFRRRYRGGGRARIRLAIANRVLANDALEAGSFPARASGGDRQRRSYRISMISFSLALAALSSFDI